ncbi:hypothetical protein K438DRAFT_1985349 [Mycena galopus ATCC 62051]|nr:hypothetical protein K438DRAFT_1985349 [Mycena galopus ATCC 62051]
MDGAELVLGTGGAGITSSCPSGEALRRLPPSPLAGGASAILFFRSSPSHLPLLPLSIPLAIPPPLALLSAVLLALVLLTLALRPRCPSPRFGIVVALPAPPHECSQLVLHGLPLRARRPLWHALGFPHSLGFRVGLGL